MPQHLLRGLRKGNKSTDKSTIILQRSYWRCVKSSILTRWTFYVIYSCDFILSGFLIIGGVTYSMILDSTQTTQTAEAVPVNLPLKRFPGHEWSCGERVGTCTSRDHVIPRLKAQPRKLRKHLSLIWGSHCQGYNQGSAPVENIQYPHTYKNPDSPLGLNVIYSFTTLTCELSTKLQCNTNIDQTSRWLRVPHPTQAPALAPALVLARVGTRSPLPERTARYFQPAVCISLLF